MLVKRVNNIFRAGEKMDGKRKKKGEEREKKTASIGELQVAREKRRVL